MLAYDFDESVGCWVAMTAHALRRALDLELSREHITFRQWEVLASLSLENEQSQTEMAERLGIEAPTLAGLISRMERDGWLVRQNCPNDRRKKRIRPTEKANEIWNRTVEMCKRVRAQATQGISAEDLQTLKRVCQTIRENLEASVPDCAPVEQAASGK